MSRVNLFDQTQENTLTAYFDASQQTSGNISYWEAVGFLFVVACSPEMIKPSQWLPIVYNTDSDHDTLEAAEETLGAFMALYNELNRQVQSSDIRLLPGCELKQNPMDNFEPEAPISQWASGFVQGYDWLEEIWVDYVPDELDEHLGFQMLVLSFFSDINLAEAFVDDSIKKDATVETMAADLQLIFIEAMSNFARLGYSIQQALLEEDSIFEQPVRSEKVGRNEPCPCGSGEKYKKCCYISQ